MNPARKHSPTAPGRPPSRRRAGVCPLASFTLLELLVVLAVLGLLAGLLLPALGRARAKGWQSRCISNLHQLGLAVQMYAQDHRHYLPVAAMQPTVNPDLPRLADLLSPYLGQQQSGALHCPADRDKVNQGQTFYEAEGSSYQWNSLLNGRLIDRTRIDLAAFALWPPIMGDYEKFHAGSGSGRNYLYADGRVEQDLRSLIQ